MATATKKVKGAGVPAGGAPHIRARGLEFSVFRDNGGRYRWELVGHSGESLAQSGIFTSRGDAERMARDVYENVGSARFEPGVPEHGEAVSA
jgi:uncharacterized protein YegP (UPF0339 family)